MNTNNVIYYNNFYQIVDCYLENFNSFQINKKIEFECEVGCIEFFKCSNTNKIIVHSIYIKEQYRKKGLCGEFIKYLIDKIGDTQTLVIQSVLSKILYEYLSRFDYNKTIFVIKKEGFIAKKLNKS
jgi:N-acetylglutamate synthase-like GNAT family acetyltransferase